MKMKMFVGLICMLWLSNTGYTEILEGQGMSKMGQKIQMGSLSIPWSRANSHYGYLYDVEGLSYANVVPGPLSWNNGSIFKSVHYKTYIGFQRLSEIDLGEVMSLTSPATLVFSTASDAFVPDERGSLLFRYRNLWGVIDFVRIDAGGLFYKYRLNTEGECRFIRGSGGAGSPGFFQKNASSWMSLDQEYPPEDSQTYDQVYDSMQKYENLEITGGASLVFTAGLTARTSLNIQDGTLVLKGGEPSYLKDVEIGVNGALIIQGDATVFVSGNWSNQGVFASSGGPVVFAGDGPRKISGYTEFYSLEIDTASRVEASKISAHILSIHSGLFIPATDSSFTHIFIGENGLLCPESQAIISVGGDLDNGGVFFHNDGTILLDGSERQYVDMGDDPFFNLVIQGEDVVFVTEPVVESIME